MSGCSCSGCPILGDSQAWRHDDRTEQATSQHQSPTFQISRTAFLISAPTQRRRPPWSRRIIVRPPIAARGMDHPAPAPVTRQLAAGRPTWSAGDAGTSADGLLGRRASARRPRTNKFFRPNVVWPPGLGRAPNFRFDRTVYSAYVRYGDIRAICEPAADGLRMAGAFRGTTDAAEIHEWRAYMGWRW